LRVIIPAFFYSDPKKAAFFNRWLELFFSTIDENFDGSVAADAKNRAELMAYMFLSRLHKMGGAPDKVVKFNPTDKIS
jgi:hemoglobin